MVDAVGVLLPLSRRCMLTARPGCAHIAAWLGSPWQCHVYRRVTAAPEQCASLFSSHSSQEVGAAPEEVIAAEAAAMKKEVRGE